MDSVPGCRVITIARTTAALAEQIGRLVSDALEFRYIDDEIVTLAADRAGVARETLEQVEHSTPLRLRLLTSLTDVLASGPPVGAVVGTWEMAVLAYQTAASSRRSMRQERSHRSLIQEVIAEVAKQGSVVILAHAASIYLAGTPGLLRVLITASAQTRARNLLAAEGLEEGDADARIAVADQERSAYLQRFYGIREELPTHYDLVVNTDMLSPEFAARAIVETAKAMG